jgi:predicted amidohydrolase YtcJ
VILLRDVEVGGRAGLDVRLADGRIAAVGERLARGGPEIDGCGGALIPGLCDHHIHLLASAARADSVALEGVRGAGDLAARIRAAAMARPIGGWIRAFGWHEAEAGDLTRAELDALSPDHPLRVQHQTGALWVLNSLALAQLADDDDPAGLDRARGRLFRGDAWLRARLPAAPPPLAPLGARLAALGVTAVTDASVTTDASAAALLADAHRTGALPQRLRLMSGGELAAPADGAFAVGAVKVLLDDHALPEFDEVVDRIARARAWGRKVAVHCVTAAELALSLAAFGAAGTEPGDRIEHGGVIGASAIGELKALGLTVVTQPAFVRERGDRYLRDVEADDQPDLYRCASLRAAGVPVAASSDAPYASFDPWLGMAAAADRRTAGGQVVAGGEAVTTAEALGLYLGAPGDPGGPARRVEPGAAADLVLLDGPLPELLAEPSAERVRLTLIDGQVVHGG